MKSTEYVKGLRGKTAQELKAEVAALRKEQFNLRMQKATGQLTKTNLVQNVRKNIARAKTALHQQVKGS